MTVIVVQDGAPVADTWVMFHDANGELVGDARTDAQGRATHSPAPSQVTIVPRSHSQLFTFTNVKDGDRLTYTEPPLPGAKPRQRGTLRVQLAGTAPDATSYVLWAGRCWGTASANTLMGDVALYDGVCPATSVLGIASGLDAGTSYAWKADVPTPDGGDVVGVALGAWASATPTSIEVLGSSPTGSARVYLRHGEDAHPVAGVNLATASTPITIPAGFGDAFTTVFETGTSTSDRSRVIRNHAAAPFVIDASQVLPSITTKNVRPVGDRRFEMTWSATASLEGVDAALATLWLDNDPSYGPYMWTILVPGATTKVVTPALPDTATIKDHITTAQPQSVALLDSDAWSGLNEVKAIAIDDLWGALVDVEPRPDLLAPKPGLQMRLRYQRWK